MSDPHPAARRAVINCLGWADPELHHDQASLQDALALPSLGWALLDCPIQPTGAGQALVAGPSPLTLFFPSGAAGAQFCPLDRADSKPSTASRQKKHIPAPGSSTYPGLSDHVGPADIDCSCKTKAAITAGSSSCPSPGVWAWPPALLTEIGIAHV